MDKAKNVEFKNRLFVLKISLLIENNATNCTKMF